MEDISDEQLFEPTSEGYTDFLHNLVVRYEDEASSGDGQEVTLDSSKDNNEDEAAKKKRGPGRPTSKKSSKERRQEANARERKRMRALVRWSIFTLWTSPLTGSSPDLK